jgi:hypothetical protein
METYPVTCPTCFEIFEVPLPAPTETPSEVDYDCEICCRPMRILFEDQYGEVTATALGIHD